MQLFLLQISGIFRDYHHIFEMNIINNPTVMGANLALVSMNVEYESRVGVRLPIRCPPPSLALSRITYDNFITWLQRFGTAKSVSEFRSFLAMPPQSSLDISPWHVTSGGRVPQERMRRPDQERVTRLGSVSSGLVPHGRLRGPEQLQRRTFGIGGSAHRRAFPCTAGNTPGGRRTRRYEGFAQGED